MSRLIIHREGQLVSCHDFTTLRRLREQEEQVTTFFGGLVVGAVPVHALLGLAESRYVTIHANDGHSTTLPWEQLENCMLVYRLGLAPLPRRLGGPFRILLAGARPCACLKYVDTVELSLQPHEERLPTCQHDAAHT